MNDRAAYSVNPLLVGGVALAFLAALTALEWSGMMTPGLLWGYWFALLLIAG